MKPEPTPTLRTISGSADMLRNADVGHMLELRERLSEAERELAAAELRTEAAERFALSVERQAERLAEALKGLLDNLKEQGNAGAGITPLFKARKALAAWGEANHPES